MAATDVEVVNFIRVRVDLSGKAYTAEDTTRTIAQNLRFTDEWRIEPDASIPETANYPTLKAYLKAMASRGAPQYPVFISQTMVVTTIH
ncbi:MAG: hypothetical protein M0P71_13810 [Melioribacteraceae bacterium]|nr:hypothetical protein [Melioribacteraceae bacterium]